MFELFLRGARPKLARHYGHVFADEVLVDARKEYDRVTGALRLRLAPIIARVHVVPSPLQVPKTDVDITILD